MLGQGIAGAAPGKEREAKLAFQHLHPPAEAILRHCSFDYMKANATASVPPGGKYERRAVQELGPDCARWLSTDDLADGIGKAA